jgi:hypothetical protein
MITDYGLYSKLVLDSFDLEMPLEFDSNMTDSRTQQRQHQFWRPHQCGKHQSWRQQKWQHIIKTHTYIYKHTLRTYSSISIIYIIIIVIIIIIIFIVIYCYNHLTKNGGPQPLFRTKNASNVMWCSPNSTGSPIHHLVNPRESQKRKFGTNCAC